MNVFSDDQHVETGQKMVKIAQCVRVCEEFLKKMFKSSWKNHFWITQSVCNMCEECMTVSDVPCDSVNKYYPWII